MSYAMSDFAAITVTRFDRDEREVFYGPVVQIADDKSFVTVTESKFFSTRGRELVHMLRAELDNEDWDGSAA